MPDRVGVARIHGLYYLATRLTPLVSMRLFEAITGPKRDHWLVRTVGLLAGVIGLALLRRDDRCDRWLPVASAASFAVVDVVGVASRTIRPVYLVDAPVEVALIAAWLRPGATRS